MLDTVTLLETITVSEGRSSSVAHGCWKKVCRSMFQCDSRSDKQNYLFLL